jgi:tetratricopeptide (TPR) repeat protein
MARPWLCLLDPGLSELQARAGSGAEDHLRLAKALNGRGRHKEAAELLDRILAGDRAHSDAWFERALSLGDHASDDEILDLLKQVETIKDEHHQNPSLLRNLGFLKIQLGDHDGAERALKQALELNGSDPRIHELMGLLCLQQDRAADAKAWLLKALSLQPKDPRTLRLLAVTCEQLGDFNGAEAQLIAALEADPNYYWGWHTLGEQLLRRGEFQEGLRCIHRARSLHIGDPSSYFIVAELLAEHGHLDIAQGHLHALILLAPEARVLSEAQALLGEYKRDLDDRDGALSYFSLATETDPEAANPWAALGDMAREEGRWDDALRCYREALMREPEAADIQVQMGYGLLETEQRGAAEQAFLKALESDPSEYSAYLGLSECYRLAGRQEDQAQMVKEAMTLAPEDPDVWNAQGVACEVRNKFSDATEAYEKALMIDPSHRKAANNLGFLLEKRMEQGEPDLKSRAIEAWKRRLLICRDEGQSLRMATEHLVKLGVEEDTLLRWLNREMVPGTAQA